MRVYLETLGCRLNYAEMAMLGRQLVSAGYDLAESATEADVCVLNSCAVTGEAARKSRQLARQLAQANPAARLVLTGCYATLESATVAELPNVSLVVGNDRKDELFALLQAQAVSWTGEPPQPDRAEDRHAGPASRTGSDRREAPAWQAEFGRTRAFVKVQDGCHNRCTFCIVTVARGEERSRPVDQVVAEIDGLHAAGYQEAVLTGVHLGAYGRDLGVDLRTLVAALLARTTIPRLRLSSLEPFDLAADFFALWRTDIGAGRLMPHLHLPAQSGSDTILRRMARRNRVADFEALVAAARACIPGLTVTTDLIAGFPGETESEFAETIEFARRVGFAHMHVFPYSARSGTAAARFGGQVPEGERRRRSRVLNDLDGELGKAVRQTYLGEQRLVLWENKVAEPAASPFDTWSGLTDNYLRVRTSAPRGLDLHNTTTPVRLQRLEGNEVWGEIVSPERSSYDS